ncbi:MAG: glycosyltransferase family 1 protein [Peptococcaceae bacterium]|nr:MAG: glycosyltransferase family 1 protein [Peptococcaceae bacterium]
MKIAALHWAFPPIIGGVETHLAMLGPELVKGGMEVFLLTGSVGGRREESRHDGILVKRTPLMDLNVLSNISIEEKAGQIRGEIYEFLYQARPDLIHAHNMHYFSTVHARVLGGIARQVGVPLVLTAHNVWSDRLWQSMLPLAGQWDAVIAVSHFIKKELVRSGYKADRITVVHHGIDLEKFSPPSGREKALLLKKYPLFSGRKIIFHPARMSLAKGSDVVVKAAALIKKEFPEFLLVLAGVEKTVDWGSSRQGEVDRIRNLINELALQENVLIRFFSWEEMPEMYRIADFCVYPSVFEEPFGLVMLESMATARPVIVSRSGGMPEVITNGVNGFIVSKGDPVSLAGQCVKLLRNPVLNREMGRQGRHIALKKFSKETMTVNTVAVYKALLEEKKGALKWKQETTA